MKRTALTTIAAAAVGIGAFGAADSVLWAQDVVRPSGWSLATHGEDAVPDYDRLFAMDRVHELLITIAPDDFAAMQEDLATIMPGFRRTAGRPAGANDAVRAIASIAQALTERVSESTSACADREPGAACSVGAADGRCAPQADASLVCLPEARPVRGALVGLGTVPPELSARDPIYVPVTVTHDGRSWPGVGMRYKGNSSLASASRSGAGKVPFRLDFDRYEDDVPGTKNQRFYGFHKLTFSSNYTDDSMLKEVLATEIFRDRGVPAARAAFYRIFVDTGDGPEYWGLYSMIEDPADGAMLDAQFGNHGGNLYKPAGPGSNWGYFDEEGFDKKTNEKAADYTDVSAAVAALHASQEDAERWRGELDARFDVEHFLRWLAVNTVIENWDSYGRMAHNYYLYGDPAEDGQLHWIPWDHNMAFGNVRAPVPRPSSQTAPPPSPNRQPMAVFGMGMGDVLHRQAGSDWPLISRILADDVYAARYRELLDEALGGLAAPQAFEARARELHAMIAPFVVGDSGERPSHTTLTSDGAFENALAALIERNRQRHNQVRLALDSATN